MSVGTVSPPRHNQLYEEIRLSSHDVRRHEWGVQSFAPCVRGTRGMSLETKV